MMAWLPTTMFFTSCRRHQTVIFYLRIPWIKKTITTKGGDHHKDLESFSWNGFGVKFLRSEVWFRIRRFESRVRLLEIFNPVISK